MGVARTETRLVLAPLRGISTLIYRQAYGAQFQGIDVAMSPFVPTVHSERINPRVLADVMPDANEGALPLIPQIIGRDAGDIRQMVEAMAGLGYGEVNWNLGCPWPQVAKKKRGSGMLPHPEYIDEVLGEVLLEVLDSQCGAGRAVPTCPRHLVRLGSARLWFQPLLVEAAPHD
jgi:tRNA-dihydrouridine synthase B